MQTIHDLPTPALLLDLDVLEENLRRTSERARGLGARLRPHVKTHKCVEIALGQRTLGAEGITVATLDEARVFAAAGFEDITWAFPVAPARAAEAAELARSIRLGVLVDAPEALEALEAADAPFRVWLKIDCGNGRAGLHPDDPRVAELWTRAAESSALEAAGILSHSGHAYRARSAGHLRRIADAEPALMARLRERLAREVGVSPEVSVGSTPAMARVRDLAGADEVRPGNYALHDFTQVALGTCGPGDCAATVLATVVSSRPAAGTSVIDAGALALSADPGPAHAPGMGRLFADGSRDTLRQNARLVSLSQEHGIVSEALPLGTRVRVLPNHSCLAVPCFGAYHVVRGEEVLDRWAIHRAR
ncbi:MAG: alanine racemase [Gemmatimonadota bacterium]|nr:alanine racemase [Gemmatimonadota bacterium]